jgi:DNA-binding beta-propeller fold protein YncE
MARKVAATVPLGYDPLMPLATPDGTRVFLIDLEKKKGRGVVSVLDGATHAVLTRIVTATRPRAALLSEDGRWLYLLHGDLSGRDKKAVSQVFVIDTVRMASVLQERVGSRPDTLIRAKSGGLVYLLTRGRPHKDPKKNEPGQIVVLGVDSATGRPTRLATIDVGGTPRVVDQLSTPDQLAILSEAASEAPRSVLSFISGSTLEKQVEVGGGEPRRLLVSADGARLYVVEEKSLSVVDRATGTETAQVALGFSAGDLLIDKDVRNAYVIEQGGSELAVIDLEKGLLDRKITTGRGSVKFGHVMSTVALVAFSAALNVASFRLGAGVGSPYYPLFYPRLGVGSHGGALAIDPDGRYLYALNVGTHDVTVVDRSDHSVVRKVGVASGGLAMLPGPRGRLLNILGQHELSVFDVSTNDRASEYPLSEVPTGRPVIDPARRRILRPVSTGIDVLSLRTGEREGRIGPLPEPVGILVPESCARLTEQESAFQAHLDDAELYWFDGKVDEAVEAYRRARAMAPGDADLFKLVVEKLASRELWDRAMTEYARWMAEAPDDPTRCLEAARFHIYRTGKPADRSLVTLLERSAERCQELDFPCGTVRWELARAYKQTGNTAAARDQAEQAMRLGETRATALLKAIEKGE